jgi:hypothetical protein
MENTVVGLRIDPNALAIAGNVYARNVIVRTTPEDVQIMFGDVMTADDGTNNFFAAAVVNMSTPHAKRFLMALASQLERAETERNDPNALKSILQSPENSEVAQ